MGGHSDRSRAVTPEAAYWQRLRLDRRSSLCVGLALISVVACAVAWSMVLVKGSVPRTNLGYWALLVPLIAWTSALVRFSPWAVRLLPTAAIAAPIAALLTVRYGVEFWIAAVLSVCGGVASLAAWRGSMVQREGPRRG